MSNTHPDSQKTSTVTLHKWGGLAACLLAVTFIVPGVIYLVGDLRSALGPYAYALADFLYGPVWAASLVTLVFVLRERLSEYAPRRMNLAMLAATLAAGAMLAVACIRAANRQYHLLHPELHLENSIPVLVVWATLVAGIAGVGWHCLGWALVLIGSASLTSHQLPRLLSVLYLVAGAASLFVYVLPDLEGQAATLGLALGVWQGIVFWLTGPGATPASERKAGQPA